MLAQRGSLRCFAQRDYLVEKGLMEEAEEAEKGASSSHAAKSCFLAVLWLTSHPELFQEVINPQTAFFFLSLPSCVVLKTSRTFCWIFWQGLWLLERLALP